MDYIESLETTKFLDLVEIEMIKQDIQAYEVDQGKNGR